MADKIIESEKPQEKVEKKVSKSSCACTGSRNIDCSEHGDKN